MERVAIFIDGPNLGRGFDLLKLVEILARGRHVVQATYYDSMPIVALEDLTIYPAESLAPFNFQIRPLPRVKKREQVDIALAIDLVGSAYEDGFDVAVVVSGDADHLLAVHKVQSLGKTVEICAWNKSVSDEVVGEFPDRLPLDGVRLEIRLRAPNTMNLARRQLSAISHQVSAC